ncbi:hypothetical protein BD289DRAFT_478750 [Coniella lustricola]|uniref:Zn(2)-C6 fungal-type domain-containing protein n=1 Tax=Coniella lustricola TaxID=2025994 RepID=A0A2T3ALZ1_9PEZI|nr:hypothetical protein BD289DRAFT_478750 [Coniella lustricola]
MAHPEPPSSSSIVDRNNKRKRDTEDASQSAPHDRTPQPPPPQSGNGAYINYLAKGPASLQLIQGDDGVFLDTLRMIGEYEGVLSRQESLAANLGAHLTGPTLVKVMENFFEGPITISQTDRRSTPPVVDWLDIVQFAKATPSEFTLTPSEHGHSCKFYLKGAHVEVTEQDWRTIVSGTLDRCNLPPPLPVEEDENRELVTLDILEQRLHILIKKADEVARKARQLNYHLSGRKAAIASRRTSTQSPPASHASSFTPHNHAQRSQLARPTSAYDLKADLLLQFTAASSPPTRPTPVRYSHNSISMPTTPVIQQGLPPMSTAKPQPLQTTQTSSRASPAAVSEHYHSHQHQTHHTEDVSEAWRQLITARTEKLERGQLIQPPCDRCRRLKVQCFKHLTACQGCTKKHAKCSWRTVTEEEMAWLKVEASNGIPGDTEGGGGDDGASRSAGYTPDPQSARSASTIETRVFAPLSNHNISTAIITNNANTNPVATGQPQVAGNEYSGSVGEARTVVAEIGARDRSIPEYGLREQRPHNSNSDHHRLSQMASVALGTETGRDPHQEHQQHQSKHH